MLRLVPFVRGAIARWHCFAKGAAPYFQNDGEQQRTKGDDHRDGSLIHVGQTRCRSDRRHSASQSDYCQKGKGKAPGLSLNRFLGGHCHAFGFTKYDNSDDR